MNITIIDDHKLLTDAIGLALKDGLKDYNLTVFNNPVSFLEAFRQGFKSDIIVTDLLMPQLSGKELIEIVRKEKQGAVKIIVLSSVNDAQTIRHCLRNGANAYVSKDAPLSELPDAIREVSADREFISPNLQKTLIKSMLTEDQYVHHLSPREKEVLHKICEGSTIKEIAYEMDLSAHTVQTYQKKIMKKFRVNRTADLIVFAIQNGLYNIRPK